MTRGFSVRLIAAVLAAAGCCRSQDTVAIAVDTARGPVLTLTSEPEGLRVYRGPSYLGSTPLRDIPVGSGPVRLTLFPADTTTWFSGSVVDSFTADGAGRFRRHVIFPKWVRVGSVPGGAEVFLRDSLLGRTPLMTFVPPATASLTVRARGYRQAELFLPPGTNVGVRADLVRDDAIILPEDAGTAPGAGRGYSAIYIASAAGVLTGATAAILKSRADTYYDEYRRTGSPGARDRVRRYDLYSGIALAAAEISLGYLIYELLSR